MTSFLVKEGEEPQKGLYFHTYMMKKLYIKPGESIDVPIRDEGVGYYSNWTNDDIVKYYDECYKEYGITTTVSGSVNG